jgi:cytochrome c oxidase subunit 1
MQLAWPGASVPLLGQMDSAQYNIFVTMHGSIMIFWVAMPVLLAAFGNLLIPLMVGADDMAFPTLNMMSYWTFLFSAILIIISFFVPGGAFGGGWTAYPPLSANGYPETIDFLGTMGGNLWIVAVFIEFVAFLMGGINFIVTTFNLRAPGLTWYRLPITVWMLLIASLDFMFSVGPLIAGAIMLLFDRTIGTGFFNPEAGGDPLLFQHMFWFFGHPEVYVLLLPALGFVTEVICTFARKTIFGYKTIIFNSIAAGLLAFVVWAHHQFISGIDPRMASFFSITTIIISIPFAVIVFAYIATLFRGSITLTTPMLWALGFIAEFLIGGVTGIFLGSSAFDIYAHDTYFVVAHFHYALFPTVIFGGMTAITFWFPKFTGKMMVPILGKIHFWFTTIGFNLLFMPLFFVGLAGQHRRIFNYSAWPELITQDLQNLRVVATICMLIICFGQIFLFLNIFWSLKKGKPAGNNPWNANSLEWVAPSPPGHGNFAEIPTVYRGPYEYSVEGSDVDFIPQNQPPAKS